MASPSQKSDPMTTPTHRVSERAAPVMPFSPLDALIDCLHEVRKAGKVKPGDTVFTVNERIAAVYLPIVKRIQAETCRRLAEEAEREARRLIEEYRGKSYLVKADVSEQIAILKDRAAWLRAKAEEEMER